MKKLLVATALMAVCASLPVYAATDAECQAEWTRADVNKDGTISDTEASRYAAALRVHDTQLADGKFDQTAFLKYCREDVFAMRKNDEGAPLKGANSFTEGQAKSKIEEAGYTNVTALKKDDNGVWRGKASKGGASTDVSLDFQGNVNGAK